MPFEPLARDVVLVSMEDALVATGECLIMETSQYDYFWGCGRDTRGLSAYGKVLMGVRARLRRLASADAGADADERG